MRKPEKKKQKTEKDLSRFEVQSGSLYHIAWCATWKEAEERVHAEIKKDIAEGKLPQNIKYFIFERSATYTVPTKDIAVKRLYEGEVLGETYTLTRS